MSTLPENSLSTREVIVNEALDQFAKYGIVETSIRSICGKLNQSTAAISYHFGSKEGLTKEVLEECLKRLSKSFDWFEMTEDFTLTAERLCRHSVAHSKEMFVLYRFTFSQDTSFFSGFRNYLLNLRTRFCKYFTQEAQRRGVTLETHEYRVRSDAFLQALMQEVLNRSLDHEKNPIDIGQWNRVMLKALLS